ncbi:MAG: hypothetical protein PHT84_04045, partial [Candidatus Pacebacteria bacterium]|nr:hypothetical protein [Candidatus Paceibacterota bacterium]
HHVAQKQITNGFPSFENSEALIAFPSKVFIVTVGRVDFLLFVCALIVMPQNNIATKIKINFFMFLRT